MRFIPLESFQFNEEYEIVVKVDGGYMIFDDWNDYYKWAKQV